MGRKGFTPTTFILVVVMLGALVGVGMMVNPKPPGPPQSPEAKAGESPTELKKQGEEMKKHMEQERQSRMKMSVEMGKKAKEHAAIKPAPVDPNAMDVSSKGFLSRDMGKEGVKKIDAEVAKYKASQPKTVPVPMPTSPLPLKSKEGDNPSPRAGMTK